VTLWRVIGRKLQGTKNPKNFCKTGTRFDSSTKFQLEFNLSRKKIQMFCLLNLNKFFKKLTNHLFFSFMTVLLFCLTLAFNDFGLFLSEAKKFKNKRRNGARGKTTD
jgi:hypothetical protein